MEWIEMHEKLDDCLLQHYFWAPLPLTHCLMALCAVLAKQCRINIKALKKIRLDVTGAWFQLHPNYDVEKCVCVFVRVCMCVSRTKIKLTSFLLVIVSFISNSLFHFWLWCRLTESKHVRTATNVTYSWFSETAARCLLIPSFERVVSLYYW